LAECRGQVLVVAQVDLHFRHGDALLGEKDAHPARARGGGAIVEFHRQVLVEVLMQVLVANPCGQVLVASPRARRRLRPTLEDIFTPKKNLPHPARAAARLFSISATARTSNSSLPAALRKREVSVCCGAHRPSLLLDRGANPTKEEIAADHIRTRQPFARGNPWRISLRSPRQSAAR